MSAISPQTGEGSLAGVTDDIFLGGRLRLLQPARGYRAGLDAVLLAAAVEEGAREAGGPATVLDAGAGVGTAGLCVAARLGGAAVTMVEIDPATAGLARANVARNGLDERVRVIEADVAAPEAVLAAAGIATGSFAHAICNPPYLDAARHRAPPDPAKAGAFTMPVDGLERWARFLARVTAAGGRLTVIHRADALRELLAALDGRFGGLRVRPIHPRAGETAHRILVGGTKGSRAPLQIEPGLVLHDESNRFRPEIEAVLRDGAALPRA